ncbi:MAG: hypothetical protein AAFY84_17700 [Pseudomonadota bacterium]
MPELIKTGHWFQIFKYAVYVLLAVNTGYFLYENLTGSAVVFRGGLRWQDVIIAFTDTIDTASWLILLLVLELETYVIPDRLLRGWVKWLLIAIGAVCSLFILYAVYGYWQTLGLPQGFASFSGDDVCALLGGDSFTVYRGFDDYPPLTIDNCGRFEGTPAYLNEALGIFASDADLSNLRRLAWTDVVNAAVWVLVVISLQIEVWHQASGRIGTTMAAGYKWLKMTLYAVLLVAVVYWLYLGEPWYAWDAALWLVAFFFIELNVLEWRAQTGSQT